MQNNDKKLQMEKIDVATKYHDIVGILDSHLNQSEVDVMINGIKLSFKISMIHSWYLVKLEEYWC